MLVSLIEQQRKIVSVYCIVKNCCKSTTFLSLSIQFFLDFADLYTRVWDVADYVVPPAENGAFFVATNVIITANQTRGKPYGFSNSLCQGKVVQLLSSFARFIS